MQTGWRRLYPAPTRFVPGRVTGSEYLDDPRVPADDRDKSYADLDLIGRLPFQFTPLWNACRRLLTGRRARLLEPSRAGRPWRFLELGSGTGEIGRRLAERARRSSIPLQVTLTDRAPATARIVKLDWLEDHLPECDVACANLVLHHFSTDDAVRALARMNEAALVGGVVYDLNRTRFAFEALRWTIPLFARSPLTVADALVSVQQAFTRSELLDLARRAGIMKPHVTTHALMRLRLWWERP
jgi:SAM-dependent methyltransferase